MNGRGWTKVSLRHEQSPSVMKNDYVHKDVFTWLFAEVGGAFDHIRSNKVSYADKWCYSVDPKVSDHHFYFANLGDALRFKLTWK